MINIIKIIKIINIIKVKTHPPLPAPSTGFAD